MTYGNSHKKIQTSKAFSTSKLRFQAGFHFMEQEQKCINKITENIITLRRYISTSDPFCLDAAVSMFWDFFFLNVSWHPNQPSILNFIARFSSFSVIFFCVLRINWLFLSLQTQYEAELWRIICKNGHRNKMGLKDISYIIFSEM